MNLTMDEFLKLAEESAPWEPCVGSGHCCTKSPCHLAYARLGAAAVAPCPQLRFDEEADRHVCGFYVDAETEEERVALKKSLSIGKGCCSTMSTPHREAIAPYMEDQRVLALIGGDATARALRRMMALTTSAPDEAPNSTTTPPDEESA